MSTYTYISEELIHLNNYVLPWHYDYEVKQIEKIQNFHESVDNIVKYTLK